MNGDEFHEDDTRPPAGVIACPGHRTSRQRGPAHMLACERHGSGEPLVLVHGVTHRRQAWYPVLDLLTSEREVILVDLPGHGDSPPLCTEGRPVEDVLRELFKEFLDEQGLDRPHVAG